MKPTRNTDAVINKTMEIPDRTPGSAMKSEGEGKAKPRGHHTVPTKWTSDVMKSSSGDRSKM